eukprot:scaffold19407_cov164-Isochrysis_galbana.AAC.2
MHHIGECDELRQNLMNSPVYTHGSLAKLANISDCVGAQGSPQKGCEGAHGWQGLPVKSGYGGAERLVERVEGVALWLEANGHLLASGRWGCGGKGVGAEQGEGERAGRIAGKKTTGDQCRPPFTLPSLTGELLQDGPLDNQGRPPVRTPQPCWGVAQ